MRHIIIALSLGLGLTIGCGGDDDDIGGDDDDVGDVDAEPGGSADASATECFDNPTTHHEIINACTDVQKIERTPDLPLWDGSGPLPIVPPGGLIECAAAVGPL